MRTREYDDIKRPHNRMTGNRKPMVETMPGVEPHRFERNKVTQRVIHDLKKRSTIGLLFYILLSFIVVSSDAFYSRHVCLSIVFLCANSGICLLRLLHLLISRKMGDRCRAQNTHIFFLSVILTALIWGLMLAMVMLREEEHVPQLITTICVAGLCAGGVVAFIPHRTLSVLFNLAMLLPAIITLIASGSNLPLAVMLLSYSAYMTLIALRGNREYWDALENEYLLEIKSREMARLSNTDVLTGLYNRRYLNEALDREWKRSGRENRLISIILFDIDHFKQINDTFGHQAGDAYLKKTAATLSSVFKRDSDIVARYGGEEFIVLLPGTDAEQAFRLACAAVLQIDNLTLRHQGQNLKTTISAGLHTAIPDFSARPDSIIAGADKALYLAKQGGKNRAVTLSPSQQNE